MSREASSQDEQNNPQLCDDNNADQLESVFHLILSLLAVCEARIAASVGAPFCPFFLIFAPRLRLAWMFAQRPRRAMSN